MPSRKKQRKKRVVAAGPPSGLATQTKTIDQIIQSPLTSTICDHDGHMGRGSGSLYTNRQLSLSGATIHSLTVVQTSGGAITVGTGTVGTHMPATAPTGTGTNATHRPQISSQASQYTSLTTSREPRRPPAHFFGRDEYVGQMVDTIDKCIGDGRGARLVVRGYGGIGKTSVALAVCHHPIVQTLFGELRFFVECETADTPARLLQEIASCLHIDLSNGDPHSLMLAGLKTMSRTRPLLLILDNAETFLYPSSHLQAKEIDAILSGISALPAITLVLTKRGVERPLALKWDALEELSVLSPAAARETFLSITGTTLVDSEDAQLDSLMAALDYVPLAVTLLAQVAQSAGENLESLHRRWSRRKTDLLKLHGRPDHRETSVRTSIEFSLQSKLMEENVHTKRLLSMLSYLPEGVLLAHVEALSAEWEVDIDDVTHVLRQLSMAHGSSNKQFLTTLSPIREHMAVHHSIIDKDLDLLRHWHLKLARRGGCPPGDPNFLLCQADLAMNRGNITYILRQCITDTLINSDLIGAVIDFSHFLKWWSPNGDLLQQILDSKHADSLETETRAQLHLRLGDIFRVQHYYGDAIRLFEMARTEFESSGNRLDTTRCIRHLGEIFRIKGDYATAKALLEQARSAFETLGNRLEIAQCTQNLGDVIGLQSDYVNAILMLKKAKKEFETLGDRYGAAQCLRRLGIISRIRGEFTSAQISLEKAGSEFELIGNRLGAAQCVQNVAVILIMQGDYSKARLLLEKAQSGFEDLGDRFGVARCFKGLGDISRQQNDYAGAKVLLKKAQAEFDTIGDRVAAAQCVQSLGEVISMQGDYVNAKITLEDARSEFELVGHREGVSQCLHRLEEILRAERDSGDSLGLCEGE